MPRYEDRYGSTTRLYVGHLSSRTRSRDLEHIFSRYGRVRDVDMKRDYAFVEFSDPRDADDARYNLDGRDVDGRRIIVEFAKGVPRGPGGVREYVGRGPAPGSGRCFNCGIDGHWARDCKAGDWKNKCYRCGERGHIERNCQNSPKKLSGRGRSYSRSPVRSRSPRRGRSRSRSFSRSHSYSRSRSPARRGRDAEYKERRSRSPRGESPESRRGTSPSKTRKLSLTPDRDEPRERSPSPSRGRMETEQDGYSDSPKETSRSPVSPAARRYDESPYAANGRNRSPSPRDDRSPVDDDDVVRSPRGTSLVNQLPGHIVSSYKILAVESPQPVMQDSGLVLYNGPRSVDYESYCQTWYDYVGLYGEPLSSTQDGSYDDSYYLTYEEVDDYSRRSWYKKGGNNQDYRGKQNPYSGSGTCLGDYTSYFGCYWGENDQFYSEEGYGAYGSSLEKEEGSLKYGSYNDKMQPDYSENEWPGYGGLDFGGGSIKEDFEYSSSWDNWEQTTLYERIFGH